MLYSSEQRHPLPVAITAMGAESVEAVVDGTLPSMQKEVTPDGGAFPAAARGREYDENTATFSTSSLRCSRDKARDASTTLGVASANVDGVEHGRGDDCLALEGHLAPLMMARNGAEDMTSVRIFESSPVSPPPRTGVARRVAAQTFPEKKTVR